MLPRNAPTICIVDDDPAELARFAKAFGEDFKVIPATTYTEAISKLKQTGRRSPHLWVLDLYFPRQGMINTADQMLEISARFEIFDRARREFVGYLHSIDQDREGGLALLARCKQDHHAPVVMFTRKGTIDDALTCLSAGAAEVLRKPMPHELPEKKEDRVSALDNALIRAKGDLVDRFTTQIAKNTHWVKNRARYLAIATFLLGLLLDRGLGWIGF